MKLTRVQVPDFRVLKNIDIEFEKEFFPSIFPLGSQNGGGKSTLLQLIFTLLHCAGVPERKQCLQNLLQGFQIPEGEIERELATLHIWDDKKETRLKFITVHDTYIKYLLKVREEYNNDFMNLSILKELEEINNTILQTEKKIAQIQESISRLEVYQTIENETLKSELSIEVIRDLVKSGLIKWQSELLMLDNLKKLGEQILNVLQLNLQEFHKRNDNLKIAHQTINQCLKNNNSIYISNYFYKTNRDKEGFLICQLNDSILDIDQAMILLEKISRKIFLAAPSSQVFLFTSQEFRKLLFQQNSNLHYDQSLKSAKSQLSGLFTYDFVPVDSLIQAFKTARDQDFIAAIKTEGEYGQHYKILLNDLNLLLVNKKVNISEDFTRVTFTVNKNNVDIEINPEDLSHGEMKRLSIYMWIKYGNIPEGSIVLMDEIEIALHPDWQYQIVLDLQEWSPNNQYILATHSYELCQPLTPAHVKSLDPQLIKS